MAYETLLYEVQDGVAVLTLNRPQNLNAFNNTMLAELADALDRARQDEGVRAVVLTGAGRAFSAGQDLKDVPDPSPGAFYRHLAERYNPVVLRIAEMPKPTLAGVNGVAVGAGCNIALACDLRIASTEARFGEVFVNIALVPDSGGTFFLPRLVGLARAMELVYTGRIIGAEEAERIGLVNRVVPPERLMEETLSLARTLAQGPTRALGLSRQALLYGLTHSLREALEFEAFCQDALSLGHDYQEGVRAFVEKRKPQFRGR